MAQQDLFSRMARDAGRGVPPPWKPRTCTGCGAELDDRTTGERCFACEWNVGHQKWKPGPGDAEALGSYVPPTRPFAHQLSALAALQGRARALLMEMGTGKTKVVIDDWAMRVEAGEVHDLVVVAPKGVYRNWEGKREDGSLGELGLHLAPELLERTLVATWRSSLTSARRRVEEVVARRDPRRPRVLLVNVEALSTVADAERAIVALLGGGRRAVMVVDESTAVRSPTASRTKALLAIGATVPESHKRICTGLPTPRSPLDLYCQFEFLDWRFLGFRSYYGFRNRYAVMASVPDPQRPGRKKEFPVGYRHIDELRDKIQARSFRVLKEECLDLPPKVYELREVSLTKEQSRAYEELRKKAYTQLDSGDYVSAPEVLTRLIRLQQVLCGFVIDEEGTEHTLPSNRLDELVQLIGESTGKTIIWAPYVRSLREVTDRLRREFGQRSAVRFWGEVRDAEREEALVRFQEDTETRFMVGNPATLGRGRTLTAASLVVYYANSPDLEHRLQSEDRAHRAGLKHSVTYVDLCARGTIDEKWIATLRRKMDLASAVTGDRARQWLV